MLIVFILVALLVATVGVWAYLINKVNKFKAPGGSDPFWS